jgi:uncharacterized protein DUF3592
VKITPVAVGYRTVPMSPVAGKLRIVALVFGAFAALGLAGAAWNVPSTVRLSAGEHAEGTVVAFKRLGRSSHPVVRYVLPDGRSVEFMSKVSRGGNVRVGEFVPVKYDPQDPSLAEVDGFSTIWGRVVIPAVIGLVFGAMAVLTLFLRRVAGQ